MLDLHISLGNLLTILAIGGGLWLQTTKLSRWQGKVDTLLEVHGEQLKRISRSLRLDATP